jgi:hypothetical protein
MSGAKRSATASADAPVSHSHLMSHVLDKGRQCICRIPIVIDDEYSQPRIRRPAAGH